MVGELFEIQQKYSFNLNNCIHIQEKYSFNFNNCIHIQEKYLFNFNYFHIHEKYLFDFNNGIHIQEKIFIQLQQLYSHSRKILIQLHYIDSRSQPSRSNLPVSNSSYSTWRKSSKLGIGCIVSLLVIVSD